MSQLLGTLLIAVIAVVAVLADRRPAVQAYRLAHLLRYYSVLAVMLMVFGFALRYVVFKDSFLRSLINALVYGAVYGALAYFLNRRRAER